MIWSVSAFDFQFANDEVCLERSAVLRIDHTSFDSDPSFIPVTLTSDLALIQLSGRYTTESTTIIWNISENRYAYRANASLSAMQQVRNVYFNVNKNREARCLY